MATSSEASDQNNVKSRRPAESAFKQQRLPAWQPILTAGTVLPTFFVIGIAFIPVGIGLLYFSDEVKEKVIDYTLCTKKGSTISCADDIKQKTSSQDPCICEMTVNLTEEFKGEVYFYYGLSNYYQNHRRYVKSRDDNQLLGHLESTVSTDCEPFAYGNESGVSKPIAPCGAIANSLFNDTLELFSVDLGKAVPVFRTGIAWDSDKNIKFRNPPFTPGQLKAAFVNHTKPSNWAKNIWELDPEDDNNNGFQNEDLIVWMRTAALPTFRKLYRRVNHNEDGFRRGLMQGLYTLTINYNYPVTDFDGTKSFIISTTSLLGGKNPFLGVAYVVVGTLCLLLGIVLLIIHVRCSKRYYPSPTESFLVALDARNTSTDRRLETLRAINRAYKTQSLSPNDQPIETNIEPSEKNTLALDSKKEEKSVEVANIEFQKPSAHVQIKPTRSTDSRKQLYVDPGKLSSEEKYKLDQAADELQKTEKGWEEYAFRYSRALHTREQRQPEIRDGPAKAEPKDDEPKRAESKKE